MIAWRLVAAHGLWILGLSILLAIGSYQRWWLGTSRRPWVRALDDRGVRLSVAAGLVLTGVGLALSLLVY